MSSQAGQSSAGNSSSSSGAGGTSSVAGQGTGGSVAGDSSVAGTSPSAGTGTGGDTGGMSTGGASGSSSAGDTSMGGTTAGSGSAGDTSMGGTSNGGTSNGGTSSNGGASGSGGSGGLVDPCPEGPAPQDGSLCLTPTPDSCFYPGTACSCLTQANTVGRRFGCYGSGDKCPAGTEQDPVPTDGASCKGFGGSTCPYSAQDFCVCVTPASSGGAEPHWQCTTDPNPVCPPMRPDKGAFCQDVKECAYADVECFCNGASWTCE
ncbi:MAG TPA: hypothetical protein VGI70_17440 [Polyangiales bacterium]